MTSRLRRLLLVLVLLASAAWSVLQHRAPGNRGPALAVNAVAPDVLRVGSLALEPCEIGRTGSGASTLRAYCATLAVPENRARPGGRRIRLRIALLRADAADPDTDLVVFLDGGPGGAATEDYPALSAAFESLRRRHRVLLVDQRGTGGSNSLDCGDQADDEAALPGGPVGGGGRSASEQENARARRRVRDCAARVATRAAPEFYTTGAAVADLEDVRQALGAPQLDLIGVSYGTRVAQQYARRYPRGVRAIVLDGAVPDDLALGSEHARNLEDALRRLFARCQADRACAERFGEPYQTLQRVRARLLAAPQTVELRDPYTFRPLRKTITADALAELVRLYAYSPYTAALLPYVIQEADAGRYAPLLGQAQVVVGDVELHVNGGMGLSVACAEDADRLHPDPADADTILGDSLTERLAGACRLWPHGRRPADFGEPLRAAVPVLLLAGEDDPVTPPRYAEAIVRTLPHGRVLRVSGQAHGLLGAGCMPRLVGDFIRTLDASGLDARCLDVLGQTPSFYDANGAGP